MAGYNAWWVIIFLSLQVVSLMKCMELEGVRRNDSRCLFEDRKACKKAERSLCEWCELPQECYHRELVKKLGASCNGSQRRQLKEVQNCAAIADKERCFSFDHCRWCRSNVLDDGCFKALEARRLPFQVFDCNKVS